MEDSQVKEGFDASESVEIVMVEIELLDVDKLSGDIIDGLDGFIVEVDWLELILFWVLPPVLL